MTTTDSNGIVFLQETDTLTPFQTMINTLQSGTSAAVGKALVGPLPAANTTERDALLATYGASTSRPLWVDMAGQLMRHTGSGGSGGWQTIAAAPTGWTNLTTYGTVGGNVNSTLQTNRIGNMVFANGILRPNSGTIPGGESTSVGVVAHPPGGGKTVTIPVTGYIAGHSLPYAPRAVLRISSSGNMTLYTEGVLSWVEINDSWLAV